MLGAERRAGHGHGAARPGDGHRDEPREVGDARLARLEGADAELLGDALGVDEVDRQAGAVGQHAAEDARREQASVEVGHAAAVGDLDGVDGRAGELHEQAAQPRTEVHVRHELVGVVPCSRDVDRAAQQSTTQDGRDLLGHGDAGVTASVRCGRLGGAREQHTRRGGERVGRDDVRFDGRRRGRDAAVVQRTSQGAVVDRAAREADDASARLELPELGLAERRRSGDGPRHDEHVGLGVHARRLDDVDRAGGRRLVRRPSDDGHAERAGALGQQTRARAHAGQPERLATYLHSVARHPG